MSGQISLKNLSGWDKFYLGLFGAALGLKLVLAAWEWVPW